MSGSKVQSLHALLEKTEHYDKDERYMATSDLCEVLKRRAASSANESFTESMTGGGGYQSSYHQQQSHMHQHSQLIDSNMERRICTAVLKLLDDTSNDVQAIAVKTLGVLLTTVHEEQVMVIADRLCSLVLEKSKSDLRDVYAIGLRTLVKTVPLQMGDVVSNRLIGPLVHGIRNNSIVSSSSNQITDDKTSEEITLSCLDILIDVITRFGSTSNSITHQHEQLLHVTLTELASERHVIRKRAATTIGCLSVVVSDVLLSRLVESLLSQIDMAEGVGKSGKRRARRAHSSSNETLKGLSNDWKVVDTRALISTICTVSGSVGHRLGQDQIDRIVPIFIRFCDPDDAISGDDDNLSCDDEMEEQDEATIALANELRESCFAGFHSFVLRCPIHIKPHLAQIVHSSLAYIRYDPNYSYGDEDGEEVEENEDFSDFEDEDYSDDPDEFSDDDDDNSWKVRRSAIRAIAAVIEVSNHDLSKLWCDEYEWRKGKKMITVAGALVNRFKEREENCRVDVIDCFRKLLSATVAAASAGEVSLATANSMDTTGDDVTLTIDIQNNFTSSVVKACEKQLSVKKGAQRTKSSALLLLTTLCTVPGGVGNEDQIKSVFNLISGILKGSTDSTGDTGQGISKSLKLDGLCLVRKILSCDQHEPLAIKNALLQILLPEICRSVEEDWHKLVAEALRVLAEIPRLLLNGSPDCPENDLVSTSMYNAIQPRLSAHDLDQEIKECALAAAVSLLINLHQSMSDMEKNNFLSLILERSKSETTRVAAIKALAAIASGNNKSVTGNKLDLSPILADTVSVLASLLRQNSRRVKQSALDALDILIRCDGNESMTNMGNGLLNLVLVELGGIIVDSDLHISHLSLDVTISILTVCPSSGASVRENVLPAALSLSTSPLLQDAALESLLSLFKQLVKHQAVQFSEFLSELKGRTAKIEEKSGHHSGSKQIIANLAKSIAAIASAASDGDRQNYVVDLLNSLEANSSNVSQEFLLALRTSGDLGQLVDLNEINGATMRLQKIYLHSFQSSSEEVKHAAAYALGRATVGSMEFFLPAILSALEEASQKKQYLLLSALRELIHCHQINGDTEITSSIPLILPHLVTHCGDEEEGVRTMVAECLGCLVCLEPDIVLPSLQELVSNNFNKVKGVEDITDGDDSPQKNSLICWTIANSVKFAIAGRANTQKLAPFMPSFLVLLKEDSLGVKNSALLMVYSAVHHNSQLVAGLMNEHISPSLYELAQMNLQRVVDMGPFKHKVDDALPLRKSALSIFATCLEKCPSSLDIPAFMPILKKALEDVEDIQLQAHQIVISLCSRHPSILVSTAESFVDPIEKTINKKTGQKSGTELERANEWIKSALRVAIALSRVDGMMNHRKFADFIERVRINAKSKAFLDDLDEVF